MKLGAFSVSLSVKDINVSLAFYKGLGFEQFAGDLSKNYLILRNESTLIGLFQGMFSGNMLTFNPGWDSLAQNIAQFDDVREIEAELLKQGIITEAQIAEKTTGPASLMLTDPDGNVILIDQHR